VYLLFNLDEATKVYSKSSRFQKPLSRRTVIFEQISKDKPKLANKHERCIEGQIHAALKLSVVNRIMI